MSTSELAERSATGPKQSAPYYVRGLALGIPVYFVAIHMWTWILSVPVMLPKGGYDFRQIYAASYMVRTGEAKELYDYYSQKKAQDETVSQQPIALPYVSPSYEALVLAPLSWFHFLTAYFLFLAVNVAALGFCFFLLQPRMLYLRSIYPWLPAALFLGFLPVGATLIEGQDSVLLMTCVIGAWVLLARERPFFAGVVLGAALFKFSIVLPIALLFVIWRQWRFILGFAASGAVFAGTSIWLTGIAQTKLYVETLFSIAGLRPPTNGLAIYPVSWQMMANVHGLVFTVASQWAPKHVVEFATISISALVMAWTMICGWRVRQASNLLLLAIPCSVLISHHAYSHDLSILLLPLVILLDCFLPSEALPGNRERVIARSAAVMFVAPVMESYSRNHFYFVAIPVMFFLWAVAAAVSDQSFTPGESAV